MQIKVAALVSVVCLAGLSGVETAESALGRPTITVDAGGPRRPVSPEMYGIFFEEINHAGDGGLYAELVQNRDMEASTIPEGWRVEGDQVITPMGWRTRKWFEDELPGWSFLAQGGAEGSLRIDANRPLNERNPHSLRLTVAKMGARCGVVNSGYWGINVCAGKWYDVSFCARTGAGEPAVAGRPRGVGLVFSLESAEGKICARATIPEVGGPWRKYTLGLHANASDPACRLIITPIEPVTVWLDVVSLFPRETFKNRPNGMRADVARMLADLKPGFLRFPGGCVVEGVTLHNRIRWKDSIGDIAQRKGDFNLWGYYSTYGLGFHEYLQLAEDLGAEAMYVCNVGMSCQARRPAQVADADELQFYVQDTLDALEYALGPVTSEWGAKRAANGRAGPFKLKYVEIGNENWGPDYLRHYKVFYDAINAKYPQIITIADAQGRGQPMPEPIEIMDDHFYVNPGRFFAMANCYDDADRNGPKVYVGEYAVNRGVGKGNLLGALSEAVFMLNMERNADIVTMCSYAPLFENVNQRNWPVNLILLDSSRVVGRSSYRVQKVFATNRPDVVLQTDVRAAEVELLGVPAGFGRGRETQPQAAPGQFVKVQQLYALAGLDGRQRELILKVVNPTPAAVTGSVILKGLSKLGAKAKVITVAHADATAENTLDAPDVIVPVESQMPVPGAEFSLPCPANSLTVLRLAAQ